MATFELRILGELPELAPIAAALGGLPKGEENRQLATYASATDPVVEVPEAAFGKPDALRVDDAPVRKGRGPAKAKTEAQPDPQQESGAAPQDTAASSDQTSTQESLDGAGSGQTATTDASPSDLNACRKLLSELMDAKGTPAAIAALAPFGASLTAIDQTKPTPEKWGEIAAALAGAK